MMRLQAIVLAGVLGCGTQAFAQATRPEPPPLPPPTLNVSGFAMLGVMNFTAANSFEATLGSPVGSIYGGGARVGLPFGGLFVGVSGWRFSHGGQRVFIYNDEAIPLGVPMEVTITPFELTAGWRFRLRRTPQFHPYVAGGLSSYGYKEVSDFATSAENVDERFSGYHLAGGADVQVERWIGVGLELNWTSVADAIGDAGVSGRFRETDLGGATLRFKITVGR